MMKRTRRGALLALGNVGLLLTAAACSGNSNNSSNANQSGTSNTSGAGGAAATLTSAQSAASPSSKPAASPVAGTSPVAVPNPQASPIAGAAPLPVGAPTPGGPPPTVVGVNSAVAPRPSAVGSFPNEGPPASPVASPAVAVASPSAQTGPTVAITPDRRFDPAQITLGRGQSLTWRNQSRNPQTVTCNPALASNASDVSLPDGAQPFDSGVININTSFSYTFDVPGDYQYVSLPFENQGMVGRVTVQG